MEAAATTAAPGWRCRPGGRLDMSHGFVRHIRRNQLARDAYDRAVRQARGRARTRLIPGPARPRRPDQQVYRPHRGGGERERGGTGGISRGGQGECPGGVPGDSGGDMEKWAPPWVRSWGSGLPPGCAPGAVGSPGWAPGAVDSPGWAPGVVGSPRVGSPEPRRAGRVTRLSQGDSAEEVTRRVCARSPLEPPLRRALCQRVQDELSKRRGTG
ncbi:UPF0561 protein C2orf68 homolog [Onychostruthus taczanowskii]|uniref:UPF0561 protein C2orf68 homolog n=1 Tax=Onychostruthus taczanowskii TaxID=356909 RepID=UPI001B7FFA96|nr:UPF0561 protein C2orf68 homolog [Onychostruthus taczanowskii]